MVIDSRYQQRAYEGPADLRAMQTLAQRLWPGGPGRWHIGELAALPLARGPRPEAEDFALWEHEGTVVGWAARPGDADGTMAPLRLQLDPDHVELAPGVVGWAASARVVVTDAEQGLLDALRGLGYRQADDHPAVLQLRRRLTDLPTPQTPEGYWLRHVRGETDAEALAGVHHAAAGGSGTAPDDGAEEYRRAMSCWPYRPDLDWLAGLTACGMAVAGCVGWLDETNRVVSLGPVATHPDHRQYGLARAAALAAMHAARRLGAIEATARVRADDPSARALHEALGFATAAREITLVRTE